MADQEDKCISYAPGVLQELKRISSKLIASDLMVASALISSLPCWIYFAQQV